MSGRVRRGIGTALVAAGVLSLAACTTTTRTERTVERDVGAGDVIVEEETTVVEDDADVCDGVISCTFDFVGDVIAFPFRLVGGLFKAIF